MTDTFGYSVCLRCEDKLKKLVKDSEASHKVGVAVSKPLITRRLSGIYSGCLSLW